jgi:PPM family protein phosphatase
MIFQDEMTDCVLHPCGPRTVAVYSAKKVGAEGPNQDVALVTPLNEGLQLLAVADGVGGARGGDQAARLAITSLERKVKQSLEAGKDLRGAILMGVDRANRAVMDLGIGAATTLIVAVINQGVVRVYHVGDSSALLVGQRGRRKLQTILHSPTGYAHEAGVLDEDAFHGHPEHHLVLNILGSEDMRIDISPRRTLAVRDRLLIGSDGLFDNMQLSEIIEMIRCGPLQQAANSLAACCRDRMATGAVELPAKPDDLTFLLVG